MKKACLFVIGSLLVTSSLFAEESGNQAAPAAAPAAPAEAAIAAAPAETAAPAAPAVVEQTTVVPAAPAVEAVPAAAPAAKAEEMLENVEFVSGEVASVDGTAKTITVKLYGETDDKAGDKVITVSVDDATDITDGDKDRDLTSLSAGTEVDVEYDPASNKATYIFVY